MKLTLPKNWQDILVTHTASQSFQKCIDFIEHEYKNKTIFPKQQDLFKALEYTKFQDVSVVIIGQDPYHQPDQAHGLAFSVPDEIALPPSLKNIYKEIESDLKIKKNFNNGNLEVWAKQGVLLLNSVLTVQANKPGSHAKHDWEEFTNHVIEKISHEQEHIVFLLWGNYAKKKGSIIDRSKHLVLETSHPSPLGAYRGFIGCKHFSQANKYLRRYNKQEIKW